MIVVTVVSNSDDYCGSRDGDCIGGGDYIDGRGGDCFGGGSHWSPL